MKYKKTDLSLRFMALIFFPLFISGCPSLSGEYSINGLFLELIEVSEETIYSDISNKQITQDEVASYAHESDDVYAHMGLCNGYFHIRNYKKFEQCREAWFKREEQKDLNPKESSLSEFKLINMTLMNMSFMTNSALLFAEQGRTAEALKRLKESYKFYDLRINYLNNNFTPSRNRYMLGQTAVLFHDPVGKAYAKLGYKDRVKTSIQELEKSKQMLLAFNHSSFKFLADILRNSKANLFMLIEDYHGAINELQDPSGNLDVYRGGNDGILHRNIKKFIFAKSLHQTKQYSRAKYYYQELISSPQIQQYGDIYYVILHDLAMIEFKEGKAKNAIQNLKKAIAAIESQRSTLNTDTGKVGFVGDKQQVYADIISILVREGQVEQALEYAEKAKSRALVDMLSSKKKFGAGKDQTKNLVLLQDLNQMEIRERQRSYAQKVVTGGTRVRGDIDAKLLEIKNYAPELASVVSVDTLNHQEIQRYLRTDETLLEFYGKDDFSVAFVVSRNAVKAIKLDIKKAAPKVALFRRQILEYNSEACIATAKEIYTNIFADLAPFIKTQKLTIVAHGSLHYLPFNALHDGNTFLVEKYSIRMLPSASVMQFLGKNTNKDDSMLVLANPDLGNAQYDLPAAELEGQAIAKDKARANVLSRKAATETVLRKYGATTSRLHIASHGQFKAEEPLKSRLLLAADGANDGNLTVDELYNLELNNNLVVLSACETGLGDVKNGGDVIGLTRGFLFAGADSIVSSLWVVDDTATANLMVAFYDGLENNTKQEALRQAQLKIKNEYNEHPFFWAAFQLTGSI